MKALLVISINDHLPTKQPCWYRSKFTYIKLKEKSLMKVSIIWLNGRVLGNYYLVFDVAIILTA